jgi:hypothetical protein
VAVNATAATAIVIVRGLAAYFALLIVLPSLRAKDGHLVPVSSFATRIVARVRVGELSSVLLRSCVDSMRGYLVAHSVQ